MENLNRKKIFNIIFLLIFLGIILSFSLFFFMVGSIEGRDNSGGEFFGLTYGVSDGDLFAYDSNFMTIGNCFNRLRFIFPAHVIVGNKTFQTADTD